MSQDRDPQSQPVRWALLHDSLSDSPQTAIAREDELLLRVGAGDAPATLRIWQTAQCIAVPGHFSKRAGFSKASRMLTQLGWPLVCRSSGGSAMPQGPGVLNVSMVLPQDRPMSIEAGFRVLSDPLLRFLESVGLAASVGPIAGSFCDGRYNLAARGRKIAGTAQKRKKTGLLSHAALQIELDLKATCDSINKLNELLGIDERCRPEAVITLTQALGKPLTTGEIRQQIVEFFDNEQPL